MYIQQALYPIKSDWSPTPVSQLPDWTEAKRICVDLETNDPLLTKLGPGVRRDSYICGVAFALENGPAYYLPIQHGTGENLQREVVLRYLKDQASAFRGEIVGANLQYDLDHLEEVGITFPNCSFYRDVLVADPLVCELHRSYSLQAVSERWGYEGKNETPMRDMARRMGIDPTKRKRGDEVKSNLWKLPPEYVAEYAISDVVLPLQILRKQEAEIERQGLQKVYDLESRLLPVLLKMRRRGVRIDTKKLQEISDWAEQVERDEMASIGLGLEDTMRAATLAPRLEEIGIKVPLTKKTRKPSVSAGLLEAHPHKVTNAILRARQFNKLRSTFCQQVWDQLIGDRCHCSYNQVRRQKDQSDSLEGAAYGRLSSTNFNITNQPIRHPEYGKMWRSIYLPDEGKEWIKGDFSQQEFRSAVHFAFLEGFPGAAKARRAYIQNPKHDIHDYTAQEAGIERDQAKTVNFGLMYTMGPGKLCRQLGLPTEPKSFEKDGEVINYIGAGEEGQAILDRYHEGMPFIKRLIKEAEKRARERGYVRTISGRKCRFPRDDEGELMWCHKAFSRVNQGSCGDQIKYAMVAADAAGHPLQITVHDELNESGDRELAMNLKKVMEGAVKLTVPSKVDIGMGPNWGSVK